MDFCQLDTTQSCSLVKEMSLEEKSFLSTGPLRHNGTCRQAKPCKQRILQGSLFYCCDDLILRNDYELVISSNWRSNLCRQLEAFRQRSCWWLALWVTQADLGRKFLMAALTLASCSDNSHCIKDKITTQMSVSFDSDIRWRRQRNARDAMMLLKKV